MSDYHIYIKMPSYLRQWFVHRHSGTEPVRLRNGSIESKHIKLAVVKPPVSAVPTRQREDEVAICIPYFNILYRHIVSQCHRSEGVAKTMESQLLPEVQLHLYHMKVVVGFLIAYLWQLVVVAVYYKEYSTLENLQLLGEEYIRQMKRDLTPKTFQTSILCQKIGISHDGFYSSMQEYHKYDASDFDYLDSLGYDRIIKEAQQDLYTIHATNQFSTLNSSIDCRTDSDIDPMQPLCIGMDYNTNINWIVCGQPRANEFERHGWQVIVVYLGNPMRHDEKYLLINQGFAGKQRLMPYFNRQNNDDLILAIQSAGVERGRNGFRKNKSMEKQPESEEDLLEHRTDGTDAFDTLYIGCEKFPQHDLYPIAIGGVR